MSYYDELAAELADAEEALRRDEEAQREADTEYAAAFDDDEELGGEA